MFIATLCSVAKICEQPVVSIDGWMDKDVVYIHNRTPFSHKNEWNPAIATTWMDLEGIMLSKISQTDKDKYHMISHIYGI